jgi:hypothetical protein
MILIAHRGNINGPNPKEENKVEYIELALSRGFQAEIDVWLIKNNIFLGHDKPQYKIKDDWLMKNKGSLWAHAKNLSAMQFLMLNKFNCFMHDTDPAVLTSQLFVWTYPGKIQIANSILVSLGKETYDLSNGVVGVCSDYIETWGKLVG